MPALRIVPAASESLAGGCGHRIRPSVPLGFSGAFVAKLRKHYAKWSTARQARIDNLMDQLWAQFGHAGKKGLQVIRGKG
jgi:hypothetical protein